MDSEVERRMDGGTFCPKGVTVWRGVGFESPDWFCATEVLSTVFLRTGAVVDGFVDVG